MLCPIMSGAPKVSGGLKDVKVLKTTQSGFEGIYAIQTQVIACVFGGPGNTSL